MQHHSLSRIYEEIKDCIGYFVKLYTLAKVARMDAPSVIRLLEIANNDLPIVEHRYERSRRDLDSIEAEKQNSARLLQELSDQISTMRKRLDSTRLDYEKEMERLRHFQQERMKQEALVKHFENNNEVYIKIRKTVEEKVINILSDRRMLLKLALLSLTESIRKNPDKYISLIYQNIPQNAASTDYSSNQYYETASYGQHQQYPSQDYITMLMEEAEKLYTSLIKELVDEIISDSTT